MPKDWVLNKSTAKSLTICKLSTSETRSPSITKSVTINEFLTWTMFVHNKEAETCSLMEGVSTTITSVDMLNKLICLIDSLKVCTGNYDENYLQLADSRKGKFYSSRNQATAFIDSSFPVTTNDGTLHNRTVRSSKCELLVGDSELERCKFCERFRPLLFSMYYRYKKNCS